MGWIHSASVRWAFVLSLVGLSFAPTWAVRSQQGPLVSIVVHVALRSDGRPTSSDASGMSAFDKALAAFSACGVRLVRGASDTIPTRHAFIEDVRGRDALATFVEPGSGTSSRAAAGRSLAQRFDTRHASEHHHLLLPELPP